MAVSCPMRACSGVVAVIRALPRAIHDDLPGYPDSRLAAGTRLRLRGEFRKLFLTAAGNVASRSIRTTGRMMILAGPVGAGSGTSRGTLRAWENSTILPMPPPNGSEFEVSFAFRPPRHILRFAATCYRCYSAPAASPHLRLRRPLAFEKVEAKERDQHSQAGFTKRQGMPTLAFVA
jgi:hypothetical protein